METNPAQLLQELAIRVADKAAELPGKGESNLSQAIAFDLGGRTALVSMGQVSEVMEVPSSTRVPGVTHWVLGVANVRGNIFPLVDMAKFFQLESDSRPERRAVIAIDRPDTRLGLVVDRVVGMRTIDLQDLAPPKDEQHFSGCVAGMAEVDSRTLPVLDIDQLLGNQKFNDVTAN